MLDLARMARIRLSPRPRFQRFLAGVLLTPNYSLAPVRIAFEGFDRVPDRPVLFAMNHTDRYNYWPLQFHLYRRLGRFTAAWVKGKYYEHPALALFMEKVNSIPTVSRGYLITRDFVSTLGRRPTDAEYDALRRHVDEATEPTASIPAALLERPRDLLGQPFDPQVADYRATIRTLFDRFMVRFTELHAEAARLGLDVIIFPQGTRSIRLSKGRPGIAHIAHRFGTPIVPVGCNGCDLAYPGSSPVARPARIVYRFGTPIEPEPIADLAPFSSAAETDHGPRLQATVDEVMARIDALLDPPYRATEDGRSLGVRGSARFI